MLHNPKEGSWVVVMPSPEISCIRLEAAWSHCPQVLSSALGFYGAQMLIYVGCGRGNLLNSIVYKPSTFLGNVQFGRQL
jgi:hypothetical protein